MRAHLYHLLEVLGKEKVLGRMMRAAGECGVWQIIMLRLDNLKTKCKNFFAMPTVLRTYRDKWNEFFRPFKIKRIRTTRRHPDGTRSWMRRVLEPFSLPYYPTLLHATDAERKNCHPIGAGYDIEWPELDYHLSVEGLLQGHPEAPGLRRVKMGALASA